MINRKSSKLERVPSPLQQETRTRSALSFDIVAEGASQQAEGLKSPSSSPPSASPTNEGEKSTFSRLSRRFLFSKSDRSGSESASAGDTSQEASPKRSTRKAGASGKADASDAAEKQDETLVGNRKSRSYFSPKTLSMLRISTKASDHEEEEEQEREGESVTPFSLNEGEEVDERGSHDATAGSADGAIASPKRYSSRLFGVKKADSTLRLPEHIDPKAYESLLAIISSRETRDGLVETLLAEHVDGGSARVRFVSAVSDWERTPNKADKVIKGKKILAAFLQKDAPFPLSGIPRDQLAAITIDTLPLMRTRILIELLENGVVAQYVKDTPIS